MKNIPETCCAQQIGYIRFNYDICVKLNMELTTSS